MQKPRIKIVSFPIPDSPVFPDEYRGGFIEVAVWPPVGVMPFVLDTVGGYDRLKEWAIDNILLGFVKGDYDEPHLREEQEFIRIFSCEGKVLLDTFVPGDHYERVPPNASYP